MPELVKLFHGTKVVPDLFEAGRWYHDFWGSWVYEAQYLDHEHSRNSANILGGTFSMEVFCPVDLNGDKPTARFVKRHGPHFINIAYWVQDIRALGQHLMDRGIRVALPGGHLVKGELPKEGLRWFIPHPKDVNGTMFEFIQDDPSFHDPRRRSWWAGSFWRDRHPLGVEGLSHATAAVANLEEASRFYTEVLGCKLAYKEENKAQKTRSNFFVLADTLFEVAMPTSDDSDMARHMAAHGPILYSFTFKVRDLGKAVAHIKANNMNPRQKGSHTVELDPTQAFGGVYGFTDRRISGHPVL